MSKFPKVLSFLNERMNIFYLSAFVPLLIFAYYHTDWFFPIIIPIYGFILLMIKKQNLQLHPQPNQVQKVLGLFIVSVSFFVYYGLVPFFPYVPFYTSANYVIYLLGLSLIFFEAPALKDIATSLFLIVAGTASPFISDWLEPYFSPYVTIQFAYLIQGIVNLFGVRATIINPTGSSPVITFPTNQGGQITALFNWYCVGVSGLLIFSTILVVLLVEEHSSLKSRVMWSVIGIAGVLILNVFRVVFILLADYFYGAEVGATIHYVIGYTLFIAWLTTFLYIFSKKTGQVST